MTIGTYISIITLNVYGLNAPTKRNRLTEWIQKTSSIFMGFTRNPLGSKDTNRLQVRGWKTIFHANGKQKKAGVAILMSDKRDLKISC